MQARDVQRFFAQVAGDWDTMRLAYYDERVIEKMVAVAGLHEGMTVADVGTGTGFVAAGLAGHTRMVVGIDNARPMLTTATQNLQTLGLANVAVVVGDTARLPLASASVDAAVANMVLHHAEAPSVMLAEMARVVKPDGAVVIVDEVEHSYAWMRTEQADVWLGFPPEQVAALFGEAGLTDYGYEPLGMQ